MFTVRKNQLANWITLTRIAGVGAIFWLTPVKTNFWLCAVIVLYTLVCLTDFLDGWVARKLQIVSDIGKILDPLADKLLVLVFLPLLEMGVISAFPVFIILAREFSIMALRVVSAKEGNIISANLSGKIKTGITLPVCGILLGRVPVEQVSELPAWLVPIEWVRLWVVGFPNWFILLLIWTTVAVTIWSFVDYFGLFLWQRYVRKAGGDEEKARRALRSFIPNTFSLLNLGCGLIASVMAWFGQFEMAVVLVILGILFDAVDGRLARILDAFSNLGAKLDSQADKVSFGVAPTVVIFSLMAERGVPTLAALGLAILYFGAVWYRLHRFLSGKGHTEYFEGLPSPAAAGIVLISCVSPILSESLHFMVIVVAVSVLMISKIPYAHLDFASRKTFMRYLTVPGFIITILTIMSLVDAPILNVAYLYELLFGLAGVYVISPLLFWLKPRR